MKPTERKLAAKLAEKKLVGDAELSAATRACEERGIAFSEYLLSHRLIDAKVLAKVEARLHRLEFLDLDGFAPTKEALSLVPQDVAVRHRALPVAVVNGALIVAVADPSNIFALDELRVKLGRPVEVVMSPAPDVDAAIQRNYPRETPRGERPTQVLERMPTQTPATSERETVGDLPTRHDSRPVPLQTAESMRDSSGSNKRLSNSEVDTLMEDSPAGAATRPSKAGVPRPAPASTEVAKETPVTILLNHLFEDVLATAGEELEFCPPTGVTVRVRVRRGGEWHDMMPYPVSFHEPIIGRLRLMAEVTLVPRDQPCDARFMLPTPQGALPVHAYFSPTARGDRALVRFPDRTPLVESPIRAIGLRAELAAEIERRISGKGGGLLFITSDDKRASMRLYHSILGELAMKRPVISLERNLQREVPNVDHVPCKDDGAIVAQLSHAAARGTDLVGIASIPDGATLRAALDCAAAGLCTLGTFVATDSATALGAYAEANADPMILSRGLIAHLHVSELARLCVKCRRPLGATPSSLPDWAAPLAGTTLFERVGCEACNNDGHAGTSWVAEAFRPATQGALQCVQSRADSLCRLAAEGWIDVREVRG